MYETIGDKDEKKQKGLYFVLKNEGTSFNWKGKFAASIKQ